ncbi:MAG: phosphoribosylformylglycinamidine cyclo-ligase [Planctomycetota bacterium]
MTPKLTYKDAGVDTVSKDKFIDRTIKMMRRTYDPRVLDNPWGFAGLFALNPKGQLFAKNYKKPVLVGCTDGVGTKLKIAFMMNKHDTVGIDLVAMSINDLVVQGAEPLFFLDYIAIGKVNDELLHHIIKGVVEGCLQAGCALLGGETAEMPGFYKENEYDLAGFAVGVVEKNKIITGQKIKQGNIIIGLASSGLHSNGYSLARKVFFETAPDKIEVRKKNVVEQPPALSRYYQELGCTLGEELLKPTRIYARAIKNILSHYRIKKAVKGIANITGGGMMENIPRILPATVSAEIEENTWPGPPIFPLIQQTGQIAKDEMFRVFNMGIGLIIVVHPFFVNAVMKQLKKSGERPYVIGKIIKGQQEVIIK